MSRKEFTENWIPFRDPLLSNYPELTDADLEAADGSTAELAKRIAKNQGIDVDEAQMTLHEFLAGPLPADAYSAPVHDNASLADSGDYIPEGEDAMSDDKRFGDDRTAETPMGRST
ncbi:hypothetical protein SAMN05444004_10866 [Jannaschia faecimaris]|uniref:Uncharacterized protein n=1 Tax=Jannaschia faecimaris TaxID=1244108 RepID=A0A1H3RDC4_9RHOB|nr:hypothetical protein [Jannaschia faecimaris]SDZ23553.1 hypothetical protein SAMN05444004_10866 [Jannaschia faecimaris]